ncbi:hypothetical protein AMECASPLE_002707, partial [Ameca splendens]
IDFSIVRLPMCSAVIKKVNKRRGFKLLVSVGPLEVGDLSAVSHLAPLWQSEPWHDEWCNNTQHSMGACIAPLAPIDIQKLSPKTYQYLQVIGNIEKPVRQCSSCRVIKFATFVNGTIDCCTKNEKKNNVCPLFLDHSL